MWLFFSPFEDLSLFIRQDLNLVLEKRSRVAEEFSWKLGVGKAASGGRFGETGGRDVIQTRWT